MCKENRVLNGIVIAVGVLMALAILSFATPGWGAENAPAADEYGEFQLLSGAGAVAVPDWRSWECTDVWADESVSYVREECVGGMDRWRTPAGEIFMIGWGYDYNAPNPTTKARLALQLQPDRDVWFVGGEGKRLPKPRYDPNRPVVEFHLVDRDGNVSPTRTIPLNPGNPGCPEIE